jgi:protein phosphatase
MEPHFRIDIGRRSDVGRVRSENQDASTVSLSVAAVPIHDRGRLLVVADGMGGERGGAEASQIATSTLKDHYYLDSNPDLPGSLLHAMRVANGKVCEHARTSPELSRMGTTCSALVINGGEAFFAHVGDSRIYFIRSGNMSQLTQDHTLVSSLVRAGYLTAEQAEKHGAKNILDRAFGQEDVEIDLGVPIELQDGDVFVLCSDGLYRVVADEEIREAAQRAPGEAADALTEAALSRGAPDNVTTIVARVCAAD